MAIRLTQSLAFGAKLRCERLFVEQPGLRERGFTSPASNRFLPMVFAVFGFGTNIAMNPHADELSGGYAHVDPNSLPRFPAHGTSRRLSGLGTGRITRVL